MSLFDFSFRPLAINLFPCPTGTVLPLRIAATSPSSSVLMPAHSVVAPPLPDCGSSLPVGTCLSDSTGTARLKVVGRILSSFQLGPHTQICPLLEALTPLETGSLELLPQKHEPALAWITLSDKGFAGLRTDESGPLMAERIRSTFALSHERGHILPDDPLVLRALVTELALGHGYDLILTSGGTGLSPRDTTPEALLPLLDRRLHGFEQAMMQASLAKTPAAAISRAICGTLGQTILITLPGSKKAVAENLDAILPALAHAIAKIHGDPSDCGKK